MPTQRGRVCQKCGAGPDAGPMALTTVTVDPERFPNAAKDGWTYGLCPACREMSPQERRQFEEESLALLEAAFTAAPIIRQENRARAAANPVAAASIRTFAKKLRDKTAELYRQASELRGIVDEMSGDQAPAFIRDSEWLRSLKAIAEDYEAMRRAGAELADSLEQEFFGTDA